MKPNQLDFSKKKIRMIIAGLPGVGKTTLAESSPKPILLDIDKGIDRIFASHRGDVSLVENYQELLKDLTEANLSEYETIVIDTGGKLIELMKQEPDVQKYSKNGSLEFKGWGLVSTMFNDFNTLLDKLDKNIVWNFHAKEGKEGDTLILRLRAEGSSKDFVWDCVDLGGFIEMKGKRRTISFSPCEKFYAKGTHGIVGSYELPDLTASSENKFLTVLFDRVRENLIEENRGAIEYQKELENKEIETQKKYNEIYELESAHIEACENEVDANMVFSELSIVVDVLTIKKDLWILLKDKAESLNLVFDKKNKEFKKGENK
jgi:GTPase SAR1 family protein